MAVRAAVFVSKRLQPPVAALLCLMAVQLAGAVLCGHPADPPPTGAVRVAIAPR